MSYDRGGVRTEAAPCRPDQVIPCDEVEKAHPDVFNVLLRVRDGGFASLCGRRAPTVLGVMAVMKS